MFKKLTSEQKEALIPQFKEIYKEYSLSEELSQKLANTYLKETDDVCDALNKLSTVPSIGNLGAFINIALTSFDDLSVNMGCTEDEKKRIALAEEKIRELPIVKNFAEDRNNRFKALFMQPAFILNFSLEGFEEYDSVVKNNLKKYENKAECSEDEKKLLSLLKEAKKILDDPLKEEQKQFVETQKIYREAYSSRSNLPLFQTPESPKNSDTPAPSLRLGRP